MYFSYRQKRIINIDRICYIFTFIFVGQNCNVIEFERSYLQSKYWFKINNFILNTYFELYSPCILILCYRRTHFYILVSHARSKETDTWYFKKIFLYPFPEIKNVPEVLYFKTCEPVLKNVFSSVSKIRFTRTEIFQIVARSKLKMSFFF